MSEGVQKKRGVFSGFINGVEVVGNKLPHPFWIFVWLIIIVVVLSAVFSMSGVSVSYMAASRQADQAPEMKIVAVKNLMSFEVLNKYLGEFTSTYAGFYPLGLIMVMLIAIGLAEHSGLIAALMRKLVIGAPLSWVIAIIALVGVNSNLASDAGVIFTPVIAAAMFKSLGMNPWVGIIAGYAAANGGFGANFFIAGTDALLAGISESVVRGNHIDFVAHPLINWYFMIASTIAITVATVLVTKFWLIPYLGGNQGTIEKSELEKHRLTEQENKAIKSTGIVALVFVLVIVAAVIPSNSFLRNADGGLLPRSPLLSSVVPIIFFFFCTVGSVYGFKVGSIKKMSDIPMMMQKSLSGALSFLIVSLPAAFFIALFSESQLTIILAVKGAELLEAANLTGFPLFILFVLLSCFVNIFITSGSAKWLILAPIFIPMFSLLGLSPAMTQMLYRIGDSCTNIISPVDLYVPVILGLLEAYKQDENQKVGIGTLISLSLPYSIAYLLAFISVLVVWYFFNLPLGPGASMFM